MTLPSGFLGSRADLLVDISLVTFIVLPWLMAAAVRLAKQRRVRAHRTAQAVLLATMTLAVALLEIDIRITGGTGALASRVIAVPGAAVRALFIVHLAIAVTTWVAWIVLVVRSWRFFGKALPGSFSPAHRVWGRRVWLGVTATATTGTLLYVSTFVL